MVVVNGQLSPQIFAAVNPEVFLNIPGMIGVLYLTLWLEATGIAHPCWLITKFFARRKADRGAGADLDFGADANAEADMALLEDEDGEALGCGGCGRGDCVWQPSDGGGATSCNRPRAVGS